MDLTGSKDLHKQGQQCVDFFVNAYTSNKEMFAKHLFSGPLTIANQQFLMDSKVDTETPLYWFFLLILKAFNRTIILRHIKDFRFEDHEIFGKVTAEDYDYGSLLYLFAPHEIEKNELVIMDRMGAEGLDKLNKFFESLLSKVNYCSINLLAEENKDIPLSIESLGWLCRFLEKTNNAKTKDELRDILIKENKDFIDVCLLWFGVRPTDLNGTEEE